MPFVVQTNIFVISYDSTIRAAKIKKYTLHVTSQQTTQEIHQDVKTIQYLSSWMLSLLAR